MTDNAPITDLVEIADLVEISRFAGERFDLVQAGGGNTSVKLDDGRIFVKASGMALSEVKGQKDFCQLSWRPLLNFLAQADASKSAAELDEEAKGVVAAALAPGAPRPSIEALLHCALGKFTLHTHPIAVASVVCRSDWQEVLQSEFPEAGGHTYMVPYKTPGAALAAVLYQKLSERNWQVGEPAIIFLQNHGLIVAGDNKQTVMQLTNEVNDKLAARLPFDLYRYKLVNFASALVNQVCGTRWLAYLSDDQILRQALVNTSSRNSLFTSPATPDQLVYCGAAALAVGNLDSLEAVALVAGHLKKFGHPPKVIICGDSDSNSNNSEHNHVLLLGPTLRKCREVEELLRSHVLLQNSDPQTMQFLSGDEIEYLNNWEAEKYRQAL